MASGVIRHIVVRGRVQGVGFRAFVQDRAHALGVTGWVRNLRDGSVEALAIGPLDAVEKLVADCRKGPPGSRVDAVDPGEGDAQARALGEAGTFTILRTP